MGADVLRAYSTFQAARSGNLPQYAAAQAAALNNPEVRAGLVNNPQLARFLGLQGGPRALPTEPSLIPNQVNVPQQFAWQPNLPPMDPITALKAAQSQDIGALRQQNPALFAAYGGFASPQQAGQVIAAAPPDVANTVLSPGGVTYAAQPIPWNLMYRGQESEFAGGPGFQGLPSGPGRLGPGGFRQPGLGGGGVPPGAVRLPPNATREDYIAGLERLGYLQPSEQIPAPQAAPQAPTAPPSQAPALPEGFVPFDLNTLHTPPTAAQPAAPQPAAPQPAAPQPQGALPPSAPPPEGEIGFPSPLEGPVSTPALPGPRPPGPPRLQQTESITEPYGAFGSRTTSRKMFDPEAEYQDSLRKQAAKGIPDPLATRVDVLTIADNAFSQMLQEYAPGNDFTKMSNFVGPGRYNIDKFISRLPFGEPISQGIRGLTGRGEEKLTSGRFRALLEGLGIPARAFAGAAFTDTEKQLYGPTFIPRGDLPLSEFRQYLTNYGRAIRDLSRTTLANYPALAPETQARLAQIVKNYERW